MIAVSSQEGARSRAAVDVEGVVLCGGASRRMGVDKAGLRPPALAGRTLLEHAVGVLDAVADRVVLATGERERYAELGRERVLDAEPGVGPLAGLVAALDGLRGEWLCVLACDMPRVGPATFRALLREAAARDLDVCLLESPAGLEPLCGVYRKTCRGPAREALGRGERRLVSFHGSPLRVGTLAAAEAAREGSATCEELTTNLNTRADWAREVESEGEDAR